ncbi:MAG TPA: SPOR domain-containing protein [Pyrinomonadaceae bacterium]|jgi:cell division septation protein DedD
MTQDDMPAPAVVSEEQPALEYLPPSPPNAPAARPQPARKPDAGATDNFAVGVRLLRLAPAWLLFTTVCCSALVVLLGWIRPAADAAAVALPTTTHNDARPARPASEPAPAAAAVAAVAPAEAPAVPPPSVAEAPAPAAQPAPQPAPAEPPAQPAPATAGATAAEKAPQPEAPAPQEVAGGKFTAQVGSFNSQSEANERVSALRAAGFDSRAVAAELPGRGTWYRVQVGRFAERAEASKAVAALRAKGAAAAAIVVPVQN